MEKTLIIGPNAEVDKIDFSASFVLAVDQGLNRLKEHHIAYDYALGDFDNFIELPKGKNIEVFSQNKDFSDFELALQYCQKNHKKNIVCYGFLNSSRLDHLINNILLLHKYADLSIQLMDANHIISVLSPGEHKITTNYHYVSFFALQPVVVTLKDGFKYPLSACEMTVTSTNAISNEVHGIGHMQIEKGCLIMIQSNGQ